MEVITQSNLRKNIYNILKEVSSENKELEVTINSKSGAMMVSSSYPKENGKPYKKNCIYNEQVLWTMFFH